MSRQNSYRLLSFYQPATQELGELAFQGEMRITLTSDWDLLLHHSNIDDLHQNKLYREYLVESTITKSDKYTLIFGTQLQQYNQEVYEGKPQAPFGQVTDSICRFHPPMAGNPCLAHRC
ncbi:MAG: hypothetical protein IPF93_14575 [Saprospiraceae bacterium]|nr:hypothetical protein [Saprospiraceae bacterium]